MTDSFPKVSLVIPVYNGSDFLAEAIDSALAQTYPNVEVLVVNDGSNDDGATERIALGYGDRIRYVAKPNGGVASALNTAVREMSGEYFSWLSHDDLYTPNKLERGMNVLLAQNDPRSIVYSDYFVFGDSLDQAIPVKLKGVPPEHFRYWITVENALHGCTLTIPRRAFEECGFFNEALRTTQDYDLWFRMARTYRFMHVPEPLVFGRHHAGQGSIQMAGVALADTPLLEDEAEFKLARRLADWPRQVEIAARAHEPHRIAFYLYDLASDFHALWNRGNEVPALRFLHEDDPARSSAKIALPRAVAVVISAGLAILGVTPAEEMR